MIKDITLGQYFPGNSAIHRLDAKTKIIITLVYIISVFIVKDYVGYVLVFAFLGGATAISRVPVGFMARGLKPVAVIMIFTFILNLFLISGDVIWSWGFLKITDQGVHQAVFMILRLFFLIIGTSLLTFTTKPVSLTDGMEGVMSPLKKIGVPAHELAMMMTIALRFIPTLLSETDKIMKAQMARGADFESGNLISRAKALVPLLVPLFVGSFRIAQDLAMAMEARCYRGGENRTRMNESKFTRLDLTAYVITVLYVTGLILMRIYL